jgi:hypothetical protein
LRQNLGKILEACLSLTSDLEGVVRKENLRVLEAVFEMVSVDKSITHENNAFQGCLIIIRSLSVEGGGT